MRGERAVVLGAHPHLLWGRGAAIIEDLFPGIVDDLTGAGTPHFDGDLSKAYFNNGGHTLPP
jgi:hypothetical protein